MAASSTPNMHCCYRMYIPQSLVKINRLIIYLRCFNLPIYDLKGVCSTVCFLLKEHINKPSVFKTSLCYWKICPIGPL